MIKRIVSFALHQPLFIVLGTVLFIGAGIAAFKALPVEALPDVTDTQVQVITLFPGRAAEEVEKQVTYPIEVSLAGMPNMIRMFSHTQFGLSFVILTFDDKANPYFARQQVLERLREATIPPGAQPQLAPLSTAVGEIYRYRVKSANLDAQGGNLRIRQTACLRRAQRANHRDRQARDINPHRPNLNRRNPRELTSCYFRELHRRHIDDIQCT